MAAQEHNQNIDRLIGLLREELMYLRPAAGYVNGKRDGIDMAIKVLERDKLPEQ